jgi:hypothetical protein
LLVIKAESHGERFDRSKIGGFAVIHASRVAPSSSDSAI